MNRALRMVVVPASVAVLVAFCPRAASAVGGRGFDGCAGNGGGDTTAIDAALACGLPPPAAATTQNTGDGSYAATGQPLIGSQCIPATSAPMPPDPDIGSRGRQYIELTPALSGNPSSGLTATATLVSPVPIGSPWGPRTLSVSPVPVQTAAQLNSEAQAEAVAIAATYNALQELEINAALAVQSSAYLRTLLATPAYSAADFYLPLLPPTAGATAVSEDATTWTMGERVYLHPGIVTHDQVGVGPRNKPIYGPEYCSGLAVSGTDPIFLRSQVPPTVATFTTQVRNIADVLWESFRRGGIVSEPAAGRPAFVGAPTCVGLDTGLPTGSATPNPFTITLPLSLTGVAGQLPVTISGRVAVSIAGNGVHWDFHDPSGDTTVHGQDSADPTAPTGTPTYDAAGGSWPNADNVCSVYHQYRGLAAAPGAMITASEHFTITVSGAYSTGAAVPTRFTYQYEPTDSPVAWSTGPFPVYQIEAVPFAPGT